MAQFEERIATGVEKIAYFQIAGTTASDTVTYTIVQGSDATTHASGSATSVVGDIWSITFTPDVADAFIVKPLWSGIDIPARVYISVGSVEVVGTETGGQLTTLQIMNKVLRKTGRIGADLTVLTALTNDQKKVWEFLVEAYGDVSTYALWQPLRKLGTITLATDDNDYSLPTDFHQEDWTSFIYDNSRRIRRASPQEIDRLRRDRTRTGEPWKYFRVADDWAFDRVPDSNANGKAIEYYYFRLPTSLDTEQPSAVTWIPRPFDDIVLVNYATMLYWISAERDQFLSYRERVFGSKDMYGSMDKMVKALESPLNSDVATLPDDRGQMSFYHDEHDY